MVEDHRARWSADVVQTTVHGHPCRMYKDRVRAVGALLREGRRWTNRTFIVHGDRRVTFGAHEAAVRRVASLLTQRGVGAGDRVGLYAANSPEWSIAFFAALEIGAIVVPINSWWSADELDHACRLTEPALLVADAKRAGRLPVGVPVLPVEALAATVDSSDPHTDVAVENPPAPDEDRPALILFTSGTTGMPKRATLSHRSVIANLQSLLVVSGRLPHQLTDDHQGSVTLTNLPLFHIGAIQLLTLPFVVGATLVFPEGRFDAATVLELIEHERVTTWSAVPTMVERVLAHPDIDRRDLTALRTIVMGGASVSRDLLDRVARTFPNAARGVGQSYGLTEAGGVLSTGVAKHLADRPGSVGRIVPVAEIRIHEPDATGIGEIWSRSPAVMDGYWKLPDDPVLTPSGWLRTGDLGRVDDDGYLYVTGRSKDMIIRGGENIAAAHVEACIAEHPDVREAAVVGLPHRELGEEVGAIVCLRSDASATPAELTTFVRRRLAHFEVPTHWWLRFDELEKTDTGKVVKHKLREQWLAQRDPVVNHAR